MGAVSSGEALYGGYGWREEALGLTCQRGGIAQDDARNRRTSSPSRPVGTTELHGKGFLSQQVLRHGARNLHEFDVSGDELLHL